MNVLAGPRDGSVQHRDRQKLFVDSDYDFELCSTKTIIVIVICFSCWISICPFWHKLFSSLILLTGFTIIFSFFAFFYLLIVIWLIFLLVQALNWLKQRQGSINNQELYTDIHWSSYYQDRDCLQLLLQLITVSLSSYNESSWDLKEVVIGSNLREKKIGYSTKVKG